MRNIPTGIQAKAAAGCSTLARCWRVTRADGAVYGFTEHDQPIDALGITFEARTGLSASDASKDLGFGVSDHEIAGGLSSEAITEEDIAAGLWDGAAVEMFLVDWENTKDVIHEFSGTTGQMRRTDTAFAVEIEGPQRQARTPQGRVYQRRCDARLGDSRCGVNLAQAVYTGTGQVLSTLNETSFAVSGLSAFQDEWFDFGVLTWTSGPNAGTSADIRSHRAGVTVVIDLWQPARSPISPGDFFDIEAGCDKKGVTCRRKFNNYLNFRGFETMPGDSAILETPGENDTKDGSSRYDFG